MVTGIYGYLYSDQITDVDVSVHSTIITKIVNNPNYHLLMTYYIGSRSYCGRELLGVICVRA